MRKYLLIPALLVGMVIGGTVYAETTDMGDEASTEYHFTYQTNISDQVTTLYITNRFQYPWQFVNIALASGEAYTNALTLKVIEVGATAYRKAAAVTTNDWGLVETNYVNVITNIAYSYFTNTLVNGVTTTNIGGSEMFAHNADAPRKLIQDYYILGGDVLVFTRTFTNSPVHIRFTGKR